MREGLRRIAAVLRWLAVLWGCIVGAVLANEVRWQDVLELTAGEVAAVGLFIGGPAALALSIAWILDGFAQDH